MTYKKLLFGLSLAGVLLAGCGKGTDATETTAPSGATSEKKLRIAVIPKGATHEFWKSVHAGADEAAKELSNVEIIWRGPEIENDREGQQKVVEAMTVEKVDGIVLAPLDDVALATPVADAQAAGIPVIIIDSGLKNAEYVSFVATDNYKGGQMAGEEMVRLLGGKGKVIMLRYSKGSASTEEREKGFMDVMAKNSGIQVVSSDKEAGPTTDSAQTAGTELLGAFKNPDGSLGVAGIYTPNESSTFGMLRVLQENNWAGKVKFVGFDASPKLIDGLKAGEINGLIIQNPHKMGYEGVKMMVAYLSGNKDQEKRVDTGATLVTKENMEQPDVAKLIAPPKN